MLQKTISAESIEIRGLSRIFADGSGLHPTDLHLRAGEFISVLGPSGCGKSTLLRCVAGLETPQSGSIQFGDRAVYDSDTQTAVPPRKRGLGMVFQDLALWPHLSAAENVAFTLRVARRPKAEITQRVTEALELVGLAQFAQKMPHQLSGGQQQRVAIARAIVGRPSILLMDEPFSALDAALRLQLRDELRKLTKSLGLTTLYVTHDQAEAMAMSDRIAVMQLGRVRQISSPEDLYLQPADQFVANFIGRCNWLPEPSDSVHAEDSQAGAVADAAAAEPKMTRGVRPEHVQVHRAPHTVPAASVVLHAAVTSCAYTGGVYALTAEVAGAPASWILEHSERIEPGTEVTLAIAPHQVMTVPAHTAEPNATPGD